MTSKERSRLKGLAMNIDPLFQMGKESLTPEFTKAVDEALEKRELVKINILKNCDDDRNAIAETLAKKRKIELSGGTD